MVRVIAKPAETETTLDALLATTFVTRVDRATLSVIAPLLSKCLKTRQSNMHRKAGMVGVVFFFLHVRPFMLAPQPTGRPMVCRIPRKLEMEENRTELHLSLVG